MNNRLKRMRDACNGKWLTIDTPKTIFLECILQECLRKMFVSKSDLDIKNALREKYKEFLGLPLDIHLKNPLTFAVSHRTHGKQMVIGWQPGMESLQDRLANDKSNNILIETRTSNFRKWKFDEAFYPTLQELVTHIKSPGRDCRHQWNPEPFQRGIRD